MKKSLLWLMVVVLAISLTAVFSLSGCKPAAEEEVAEEVEEEVAEEVEEEVAEEVEEKIVLKHWFTWGSMGIEEQKAYEKIIDGFESENPNVEITREVYNMHDMKTVLPIHILGGTGPDIMYYASGPGFGGALAESGLLLDLAEAWETKGWNDRIFGWTKEQTTSSSGIVYGIGNEVESIGYFYNKDIFNELGVDVPQTYAEFLQICDKAKAAGYIPVAFGDQEKWPAYHQFSMTANNLAGIDKMNSVLFGDGSWDDPVFAKAIKLFFVDMNEAGYFPPDAAGIVYADANSLYYQKKAAMIPTGMWLINDITTNTDFETGMFYFPSIEGSDVLPPAGLGGAFMVSKNCEYPEIAIDFLDYVYKQENAKIFIEELNFFPPYDIDIEDYDISDLLKVAVSLQESQPQMGYNIDVLTGAKFNDVQGTGFQQILLGQNTPEKLVKELQEAKLMDLEGAESE